MTPDELSPPPGLRPGPPTPDAPRPPVRPLRPAFLILGLALGLLIAVPLALYALIDPMGLVLDLGIGGGPLLLQGIAP